MLQLTKNQRADVMKLIAGEQSRLSKVSGDGTTFEEGFAAGRISLLMDLLVGKPIDDPSPNPSGETTRRRGSGVHIAIGNSPGERETAAAKS